MKKVSKEINLSNGIVYHLQSEIGKVMVGQGQLVGRVLMALLADGHVLLEGVPGLAKTLLVKTVARAIQADFARIQFTPDLLPADLIGTQIYKPQSHEFTVRSAPARRDATPPSRCSSSHAEHGNQG